MCTDHVAQVHRLCGSAPCDLLLFSQQGESYDDYVEQRLCYICSTSATKAKNRKLSVEL